MRRGKPSITFGAAAFLILGLLLQSRNSHLISDQRLFVIKDTSESGFVSADPLAGLSILLDTSERAVETHASQRRYRNAEPK